MFVLLLSSVGDESRGALNVISREYPRQGLQWKGGPRHVQAGYHYRHIPVAKYRLPHNSCHMPFAYFDRLSPARKRIYLRSDSIERVDLPQSPSAERLVNDMESALASENRGEAERFAQALLNDLCVRLKVPRVRVRVLSVRPSGNWGELHGLYEPFDDGTPPLITVWMRTVAKKQVVAFKTFLRTVLHELCHHLDYELYKLPETFHTQGFYKRESSLYYQLRGEPQKSVSA